MHRGELNVRTPAISHDTLSQQLTKQLEEKERRITELVVGQRSKSDIEKLEQWEGLSKKIALLEVAKKRLEGKLSEARDGWAESRGDRDAAVQSTEEQHAKFNKRWSELVHTFVPGSSGCENGDDDFDALLSAESEAQAKEVVQLEHKLSQALENVRQSESSRQALKDALMMNESLQAKLDELKAKYNTLRSTTSATALKGSTPSESQTPLQPQASASATLSVEALKEESASNAKDALSNNSGGGPNSASDRVEKLHREHRRMRKEITAVVASKEAAKAKLERAEKERDSLLETNARLLKQMTEKDEMNAKSLSTILHLKSMTEELKKERDSLEQQAKSASQLALTARLASNAKDRVSEEIVKEKQALETTVETLESNLAESRRRLDAITVELASVSGKTAAANAELSSALNRCQELVGEIEKKSAEIRVLTDALGKAERETRDLTGKLQKLMKQPGGGDASSMASGVSSFTVDQLNTQISVLKNRLACPVCHYRDKECIIMRCRHMHCKQCVEERITNRSRKCPTCNNKFSDKDVEDIWLN
jgi:E3 ubiquitin-protein ligase BRE1